MFQKQSPPDSLVSLSVWQPLHIFLFESLTHLSLSTSLTSADCSSVISKFGADPNFLVKIQSDEVFPYHF